ncbi:MAG TPA: monofunctional biosynthetic peptidoglycan transglycosylase [Rubricoccaceae bacterium]|nr:monofunctional biosynthetic peptidoglycan transglycosylase [Rubricoccaceae bacterium]
MRERAKAPRAKPARRGPRQVLWRLVKLLVGIAVGYLVLCTVLLAFYRFVDPPFTMVHLQRRVESLFTDEPLAYRYEPVPASAMAPAVRHAVVASEDSRFYTHKGFDLIELRAAREQARRTGRPMRGASTITQQLVKNLFFTTHRLLIRKAFEVPLTFIAELILPKERILTLYLNVVEWGPGIYGIEAAADHHYGRNASGLSRNQAARLAAILPNPRERSPGRWGGAARRIERRMRQMGW